jgi:hypothetical protein
LSGDWLTSSLDRLSRPAALVAVAEVRPLAVAVMRPFSMIDMADPIV